MPPWPFTSPPAWAGPGMTVQGPKGRGWVVLWSVVFASASCLPEFCIVSPSCTPPESRTQQSGRLQSPVGPSQHRMALEGHMASKASFAPLSLSIHSQNHITITGRFRRTRNSNCVAWRWACWEKVPGTIALTCHPWQLPDAIRGHLG